jgi:hypothetical protein
MHTSLKIHPRPRREAVGISIKPSIGLGDALQFSSLPENYFRTTGEKLIDVSRPWFFDFNPYVDRSGERTPARVQELWNWPNQYQWPKPRPHVYLSNAEIHAAVLNVGTVLNRPRLYRFEDVAFETRRKILIQVAGKSHGQLSDKIIQHVLEKYGPTGHLLQIGDGPDIGGGIPRAPMGSPWDLAELVSKCRMIIGPDSGPCWVGCCYPDVIVKVVRTRQTADALKTWVPLEITNIHSFWDDRARQVYNQTEDDIGFTYSYRRL